MSRVGVQKERLLSRLSKIGRNYNFGSRIAIFKFHVSLAYMNDDPITILIAEDDPEDMELIVGAILVAEPTAHLHKFADGLSAVEYLRTRSEEDLPSLIILDYNMPGLTGAQVLRSISTEERYKLIPKVVLSTSNAALHKYECMRNGAAEYFVKPSSWKELNDLAKTILKLR